MTVNVRPLLGVSPIDQVSKNDLTTVVYLEQTETENNICYSFRSSVEHTDQSFRFARNTGDSWHGEGPYRKGLFIWREAITAIDHVQTRNYGETYTHLAENHPYRYYLNLIWCLRYIPVTCSNYFWKMRRSIQTRRMDPSHRRYGLPAVNIMPDSQDAAFASGGSYVVWNEPLGKGEEYLRTVTGCFLLLIACGATCFPILLTSSKSKLENRLDWIRIVASFGMFASLSLPSLLCAWMFHKQQKPKRFRREHYMGGFITAKRLAYLIRNDTPGAITLANLESVLFGQHLWIKPVFVYCSLIICLG